MCWILSGDIVGLIHVVAALHAIIREPDLDHQCIMPRRARELEEIYMLYTYHLATIAVLLRVAQRSAFHHRDKIL